MTGNRGAPGGISESVGAEPDVEQRLIDRARGGDPHAREQLVRLHQQIAFRTAYVVCGSAQDAEEAVQDGFVKAFGALGRFRVGAPFRPWLLAIVANEARGRRRSSARRSAWTERAAAQALACGTGVAASAEETAIARERRQSLLAAIARLGDRDREAIELRFLLGLGEDEMASALGCRRGTVKSRLSRALARLRAQLEQSSPGGGS